MTESRELSDLKLTREECQSAEQHGLMETMFGRALEMSGNDLDLAGLVCNKLGDETCINPMKGFDGGQTWEERLGTLRKLQEEDL